MHVQFLQVCKNMKGVYLLYFSLGLNGFDIFISQIKT